LIGSFLDSIAIDGGALLLLGEPGVGKTALLDTAAEMASVAGQLVLRAAGAEFEADMAFSGLSETLMGLYGQFGQLSAVHRHALCTALGFEDGPAADRLLLSGAVLALLRQSSRVRPVLLVIDDVQWLDRPSATVLGIVSRRLAGSKAGILAASRQRSDSFFGHGVLPGFEIQPLEPAAAASLVDARFPALSRKVRQRVLTEAQGNPLALLELAPLLSGSHLGPGHALPAVLPLSKRLQAVFASRIGDMPPATRRLLLLAALEGSGGLGVLLAASGDRSLDDLLPAERADLVALDRGTGRLAFRHPLVGSAVVELAAYSERRQANQALARAFSDQPERSAWYLAEATVEPDEHVAGLLDQAGQHALRRGDAVGAVSALLRAADLTPQGSDRSRRLAQAAYVGADVTGELREVPRLLRDARKADPEMRGSLEAAVATAYLLLNEDGDIDTAHRLLTDAIEMRAGRYEAGDHALIEALYTLFFVCLFGGRPKLWEPFRAAVSRLRPGPPLILSLCVTLFTDPGRASLAEIGQLETIISRLHEEADPATIVRIGRAAFAVDRMTACREAHWRVVRDGRAGGSVASAIWALINLCLDYYATGEWDEAWQLADEGMQFCEAHGYHLLSWPFWSAMALVAANRGDSATARTLTDTMEWWAAPRGAAIVQWYARHARALIAFGQFDFQEAYEQLSEISPPGRFPPRNRYAILATLDLVEAAVRTNHHAEAIAHSDAMRDTGIAALSPRMSLVSLGSAAMANPGDHDFELFEQALAIPEAAHWPFDQARIELAYGERLRRVRATGAARRHLNAALNTFKSLDAHPWTIRAIHELRASGVVELSANGVVENLGPVELTPQEWEIATLAATGLTNRQIAERLFISHRTVAAHLYRIFPKLGIASRAALRDALDELRLALQRRAVMVSAVAA
jgi:DNA-binding CsgD family transcriptional regulator